MISDKKFYQIMAIIIVGASIAVGVKSADFWIASISTFFGLSLFAFIVVGWYIVYSLFATNGRSLRQMIGWGGGEKYADLGD